MNYTNENMPKKERFCFCFCFWVTQYAMEPLENFKDCP